MATSHTILVVSNATWSVSTSDESWLTADNFHNNTGTGSFRINVRENNSTDSSISRTGTITVTVSGALPRTVTVTQDRYIWHDAEDTRVAFWPGSTNVHIQTLGEVSDGFQFRSRVLDASRLWGNALNIMIFETTFAANAQIQAFGGRHDAIAEHLGYSEFLYSGYALIPRGDRVGSIIAGGVERDVHSLLGRQAQMFIAQNSTEAIWSERDINLTRMITAHEIGHVLGFIGHPSQIVSNARDVMWYRNHEQFLPQPNEVRHLRQIYDKFR